MVNLVRLSVPMTYLKNELDAPADSNWMRHTCLGIYAVEAEIVAYLTPGRLLMQLTGGCFIGGG